jgi:chorismate mutase
MPDGDIVHSQLSWFYQKPYKLLCEGKDNSSEYAWVVKGAVIRDIKKNYGIGITYAKQIGEMFRQAMENADQNSCVNYAALSTEIDRQVGQAKVKHHVQELLRRAAKGILHEFRYNHTAETSNLPEAVVKRLFQEIYKSNFEQRIPLTSNHHADVDNATITERVEALSSDILGEISKWASKATADGDVKNLRRSPRKKVKEIDLDEDLL